jgi:hypothetical protein
LNDLRTFSRLFSQTQKAFFHVSFWLGFLLEYADIELRNTIMPKGGELSRAKKRVRSLIMRLGDNI